MNFLKGRMNGASFEGAGGVSIALPTAGNGSTGTEVVLGVRPEHLRLADDGFPVTVSVVEPTGSEVQIIGRTPAGEEVVATSRERHDFAPGETIRLSAEPKLIHLFRGDTGTRL